MIVLHAQNCAGVVVQNRFEELKQKVLTGKSNESARLAPIFGSYEFKSEKSRRIRELW
jgi:hypothetical protein